MFLFVFILLNFAESLLGKERILYMNLFDIEGNSKEIIEEYKIFFKLSYSCFFSSLLSISYA